jgi:hypothetical protein
LLAWSSLAYLYPGLHPDGFEDPDSGCAPPESASICGFDSQEIIFAGFELFRGE